MGIIHLPDLDIGRCQNYRSITHADGYIETLRCLDYEGRPHTCEFSPSHHVVLDHPGWFNTYTPPKPKPWVKPGDAPEVGGLRDQPERGRDGGKSLDETVESDLP